jgi:hypothetical protein
MKAGRVVMKESPVPVIEHLLALEKYRGEVDAAGRKWDAVQAMAALQIDPGWFYDRVTMDMIQWFLFYKQAPHEAFDVPMSDQPQAWVDVSTMLSGVLGVSL